MYSLSSIYYPTWRHPSQRCRRLPFNYTRGTGFSPLREGKKAGGSSSASTDTGPVGESVVAVALGVADSDWMFTSAVGAVLGFLTVACLWLVALVAFEVSRSLRSDAPPSPEPSAE